MSKGSEVAKVSVHTAPQLCALGDCLDFLATDTLIQAELTGRRKSLGLSTPAAQAHA